MSKHITKTNYVAVKNTISYKEFKICILDDGHIYVDGINLET